MTTETDPIAPHGGTLIDPRAAGFAQAMAGFASTDAASLPPIAHGASALTPLINGTGSAGRAAR